MPLDILDYYYKITDLNTNSPQTSTAVSLACTEDGQNIYLAYVGKGGQNVWWLQGEPGIGVSWDNEQVRIDGQFPLLSQIRPAIVVFKGQPTIITITMDLLNISVSSFDGAQWHAVTSPIPRAADAVCATVLNNHLHIFYTANGGIWQITATDLPPTALGPPQLRFQPGDKGTPPIWSHSLAVCTSPVDKGNVFLFSVPWHSGNASYMFFNPDPNNWNLPTPQAIEPSVLLGSNYLFTRFATFAILGVKFSTFIYLAQTWGDYLQSADSTDDFTAVPPPPLRLTPSEGISGPNGAAETKLEPAVLSDPNLRHHLYLAHHGEHSGNIWFGYGRVNS
jgi:hypothetical protein